MMFQAPKDFEMPEGLKEGDTFDAMATFVMKPGGMLGIEALEGSPVGTSEEDEESSDDQAEDKMENEEEGGMESEENPTPKNGRGMMNRERGGMGPSFLIAIEKGMTSKKK